MSAAQGQDKTGPQREGDTSSRGWSWWWFLLPVLYVLSIGPAARLHRACPPLQKPIEAVYLPVTTLCTRVPLCERAVEWYLVNIWAFPVPVVK